MFRRHSFQALETFSRRSLLLILFSYSTMVLRALAEPIAERIDARMDPNDNYWVSGRTLLSDPYHLPWLIVF